MKKVLRFLVIVCVCVICLPDVYGQTIWPTPEVESLYKEARAFHSKGNFREAIIRYQQAIRIAPDIVLLHRELAHTYYLVQGYEEAMTTLEPIIESNKADAETYSIMARCLIATGEDKKAKKLLKDAVDKLPNAGTLYHEMGQRYEAEGDIAGALQWWLQGIEKDPSYHLNYYEAARTYMSTKKTVWAILYAEMFINMEQQTPRSYDTRKMLLAAYAKLYNTLATGAIPKFGEKTNSKPNNFESAVYDTYIQLAPVVSDGITTENLIMLRTRFIMDWTVKYAEKYPFSLYTRHDDMIRNGYFDAYNQWLFGKMENEQQFDAWVRFHKDALPGFETWLRNNRYQPVKRDSYNDKVVEGIFEKQKQ